MHNNKIKFCCSYWKCETQIWSTVTKISSSVEGIQEDNADEPTKASINGVSSVDGRDGEDQYLLRERTSICRVWKQKMVLYSLCIDLMHRNNRNEEEPRSLLPKNSFLLRRKIRILRRRFHGGPTCLTLRWCLIQATGQGFKY